MDAKEAAEIIEAQIKSIDMLRELVSEQEKQLKKAEDDLAVMEGRYMRETAAAISAQSYARQTDSFYREEQALRAKAYAELAEAKAQVFHLKREVAKKVLP